MQVEAFSDLLKKYQDFDISPAAESVDKVMARFEQPWTRYYYIMAGGIKVGAVRVIDKQDGSRKRISPIWIMKEYRNKGYAQQAIRAVEKIYGSDHWCLDTILQEKSNLYLYEKLGYHRTGKVDRINDRMDIVYFEKDEDEHRDPAIIPHFSCHHLRHTFCTRFCENETNVKVIQSIMGHASIETTMDIYAEVTEMTKKEALDNLSANLDIF